MLELVDLVHSTNLHAVCIRTSMHTVVLDLNNVVCITRPETRDFLQRISLFNYSINIQNTAVEGMPDER